jgi:hypothetical protein
MFYGEPITLPATKPKEVGEAVGGVSRDRSAEAVRMKMMRARRSVDNRAVATIMGGLELLVLGGLPTTANLALT